MEIKIDDGRYDTLQLYLTRQLVKVIHGALSGIGVTDEETLRQETENLAFAITSIIDGSRVMEMNGQPVVPVLTFSPTRDAESLIWAGGNSWMHEYVFGMVDDLEEGD